MKALQKWIRAVAWSPVAWGLAATAAFYIPLHSGAIDNEFLQRYFVSHEIEHVATCLFFVGVAALLIKRVRVTAEIATLDRPHLGALSKEPIPVEHCAAMLERLAKKGAADSSGYLPRRLREAIEFVRRKESAQDLDEQLRYLADLDVARMHQSYSLVNIIIWAIPILGLLGTVIGITKAVANLSSESLENAVGAVTSGLAVAFDHTALALALSIALMFAKYFVERLEHRLLAGVDDRTNVILVGRFADAAGGLTPDATAMRRMTEHIGKSIERSVSLQAELWKTTIDEAHRRWSQLSTLTGQQLETALGAAIAKATLSHAQALEEIERAAAEQNRRHWSQVQQALVKNADAITAQQQELVRQGEVFTQVVQATGEIAKLETELNRNLAALSGSQQIEEAMVTLSAAIQLLTSRVGGGKIDASRVELKPRGRSSNAA